MRRNRMSDQKKHSDTKTEVAEDRGKNPRPVEDSELEKVSGGEVVERTGSRWDLYRFFR